jgi:hypothetical protein
MAHAAPLRSANPIQSSERFGPLTVRVMITHASRSEVAGRLHMIRYSKCSRFAPMIYRWTISTSTQVS